jgi:AcrR family transcriptional regulator
VTSRGRATREALLAAARRIFARDGFFDARITDITTEAGVSAGSFYNYFNSKEELFREVACAVIDELTAAPRRDPDNPEGDPARDVQHAVRAYVEVCARHARLTASIQQVSHVDPALGAYRTRKAAENAARGARYLRQLQDVGIAPTDLDAAATASALQSMVIGAVYDQLVLVEGADLDQLTDTLTRIWLRTIGIETPVATVRAGRRRPIAP